MEKRSRSRRALWADPLCSEFVESEEFYSKVSAPQELIAELTLSNKRVKVEIRIQLCVQNAQRWSGRHHRTLLGGGEVPSGSWVHGQAEIIAKDSPL